MTSHKRKRILIDPSAQLALAGSIAIHWCCFLGLIVLMSIGVEIIVQYPDLSPTSIAQGIGNRHGPTMILMLLVCPLFIYRSVKFSHRFAGPIWRLRRDLRRLREGHSMAPIQFRKNDYWHDLAGDVNWIVAQLEQSRSRQSELAASEHNSGRPSALHCNLVGSD